MDNNKKVHRQPTTRGHPIPTHHICRLSMNVSAAHLLLHLFKSPECVLQVIASGKGNGAEEALNGRNCVQEQRL